MPDFGFDDWMDAQLRNVSVPRDLHARLRAARPAADDPASAGSPEEDPIDARMDALLRNVEVPPHLHRQLRAIARRQLLPWTWDQATRRVWVAAASLVILAGAGIYWVIPSREDGRANLAARPESATLPPTVNRSVVAAQPAKSEPAGPRSPRRQAPVTVPLGQPQMAEGEPQSLFKNVAGVSTSIRQAIEAQRRAQLALGANDQIEPLPEFEVLEPPVARGIAPPRVQGYDMLFQLRHGEHPFVVPAANKALEVSRVPFTFRTASYDQAAESVAAGRLPVSDEVRVEDFLAAQSYILPTAPAGLTLHTAGCPSPLSEPGKHLLQLTLQAGLGRRANQKPTRLIAVVDTSAPMQTGARNKMVVRALSKLGPHLLPGDNLTLIGFAESPTVLLENAGRDELAALSASGGLKLSGGSADLLAAVQAAAEAIAALPTNENRRVVFISAGGKLHPDRMDAARQSLKKLSVGGARCDFIELSPGTDVAAWQQLVRNARGRVTVAHSADEVFAVCAESLTGRPSAVARGVSMRIAFNPKTVAGYRLLGHEAATLTGDAGDPLVVDLHADQTATCMYELWLRPGGKGDLAAVELIWSDPNGGQQRRRVQPIRAEHLAASFAQAPAWVQQGVIAARTAEFLRVSFYVPNSRQLGQLLELAGEVDSGVAKSPEFRGLVRLIEQADRLR